MEMDMLRVRLLGFALGLGVAGCSGTERTAPEIQSHLHLSAASPTTIAGLPGEVPAIPPSVQVAIPLGSAVPGVKVLFTFSGNRGADFSTVTDSQGFATLQNMTFDTRPGTDTITATVDGVGGVAFTAISLSGKIVATYDLRAVGGRSGPPFIFKSEEEIGQLNGLHYQLLDDGTYRIGYVITDKTEWGRAAPYKVRSDGVIEFYLDPLSTEAASSFYSARNYLYAVGTITGDVMNLAYQDAFDYEPEEYVLKK
jgi:hypothetical protein